MISGWRASIGLLVTCLLPAAMAAQPAANIVSIQGTGQFRPDDRTAWSSAKVEQALMTGQFVRTGEFSRMGVLFADRTQLRLNEKTVLQVKSSDTETRVRLERGRAWTQSKTLPRRLYMETPSATSAIRGTDWELEVDQTGRTVLTVLSGEVEFFNDFGRVLVKANEAAEARIGQAPVKLTLVRPRDRVQWVSAYAIDPLHHVSLSGRHPAELTQALAATAESGRGRILADLGRWQEAEQAFGTGDPLGAGYAALHRGSLDEAQRNFERAAARDGRDAELLALGQASLLVLNEELAMAFVALTDLIRRPRLEQPAAFLLLSDLMVYAGDLEGAKDYLQQGLKLFPDDARLHSALARSHLLADERVKSGEEIGQALRQDSLSVEAHLAQGELARIEGDASGATAAYRKATTIRPADDRGWYGQGRVHTEREEVREGRAHLRQALALNPRGPGYQGELGTLESFANNFGEARAAFETALAQNPADYVALTGLGLLELKRGHTEAALEKFLRAGLMEPRYARVHIYTAAAYYQTGRVQQALDELKLASQLDEKDPLPHFMASVIYTDTMRPGLAIASSRKALSLLPYLKSLNQLANDQQGLTNLGQAFAFLGMDEWAQHYAQDSYYPYWAGSHLFLADRYAGLFTKNSELFQGFLSDPTAFGGGSRLQPLIPRPVHNFSVSQRVTSAEGLHGTAPDVKVSGFVNGTLPVAYFADHERFNLSTTDGPWDQQTSTVALGAMPRHDLGFMLYADDSDLDTSGNYSQLIFDEKLKSGRADLGLNYKFSPDSQLWIKGGEFRSEDLVTGTLVGSAVSNQTKVRQPEAGLRHTVTLGGTHEASWGVERGHRKTELDFFVYDQLQPGDNLQIAQRYDEKSLDAYVSDRWRATPRLLLQWDLFYQKHQRTARQDDSWNYPPMALSIPLANTTDDVSRSRINPRLGLVYRFDGGPQLRVAYQQWMRPALFSSLGPVATAGIPVDDRLVMRGGELKRLRGQFEWELSQRSFVSLHLDHKLIDNQRFNITTPFTISELESLSKLRPRRLATLANDDMLEFVNTPEYAGGRIRSGGLAINHLLTSQWGVFGRYVRTSSSNTGTTYEGNWVPYVPERIFAAGATWAHPGGLYVIGRAVHRSSRYVDEANLSALEPGWSGAFDLYWQSKERQWLFRLSADDAFDKNKSTQYTAEATLQF